MEPLEIGRALHFASLWLAGGAAIGGWLVMRVGRREKVAPGAAKRLSQSFALTGLLAILGLWATGLWLWIAQYDGADLGSLFTLKLVAAFAILALIAYLNLAVLRVWRGGKPLDPARAGQINLALRLLALFAIVAGVTTFN